MVLTSICQGPGVVTAPLHQIWNGRQVVAMVSQGLLGEEGGIHAVGVGLAKLWEESLAGCRPSGPTRLAVRVVRVVRVRSG